MRMPRRLEIVTLDNAVYMGDEERSGIFTGSAHLSVRASVDEESEQCHCGICSIFLWNIKVCDKSLYSSALLKIPLRVYRVYNGAEGHGGAHGLPTVTGI